MINIIASSRYKLNRKKIKLTVRKNLSNLGYKENFILNLVFVGKTKMKAIAKKYKKEKTPFPVLAFFYKDELIGEIIICYPQAVLLAAQWSKKVYDVVIYLINHSLKNFLLRY